MPAAANVAVVAALVLVLGQLTPAAASGVCGSDPNRVSPSGDGSDCACDGGYEPGCAGDDSAASFPWSGEGPSTFDCSNLGDWVPLTHCVSSGACTSCCATCAAECAAAGESTGCTACEAGERRALSRSSSAARVALPRVSWWQSHTGPDVWLLRRGQASTRRDRGRAIARPARQVRRRMRGMMRRVLG